MNMRRPSGGMRSGTMGIQQQRQQPRQQQAQPVQHNFSGLANMRTKLEEQIDSLTDKNQRLVSAAKFIMIDPNTLPDSELKTRWVLFNKAVAECEVK